MIIEKKLIFKYEFLIASICIASIRRIKCKKGKRRTFSKLHLAIIISK
jgi:hypothetical protein